ncbi:hypothetical protein [Deinococcus sp.]|uniref:hypothetical protein n=1 Tax=Deinococcus sp. TaxID=47478 RepID=UPI0025CEDE63|nr:hypothetical protein [Deinococcus sp.]
MPRTFAVVKASYTRSGGEAKASVRYMQYRHSEQAERHARPLFGAHGELSRQEVYAQLDQAARSAEKTYFYRLTLNPGEHHADLSEDERRAWATEVMTRLETHGVQVRSWAGVSHTDQGQHDHVHLLAATSRTLQKDELADLRTFSRQAYDAQREHQHELGVYHDHPDNAQQLSQQHQHERSYEQDQAQAQIEQERAAHWDFSL